LGQAVAGGAGFDDLPGEGESVDDGRGSVNVLVQPENGSLEAMATAERSSGSVNTWKSSSAPRR